MALRFPTVVWAELVRNGDKEVGVPELAALEHVQLLNPHRAVVAGFFLNLSLHGLLRVFTGVNGTADNAPRVRFVHVGAAVLNEDTAGVLGQKDCARTLRTPELAGLVGVRCCGDALL